MQNTYYLHHCYEMIVKANQKIAQILRNMAAYGVNSVNAENLFYALRDRGVYWRIKTHIERESQ